MEKRLIEWNSVYKFIDNIMPGIKTRVNNNAEVFTFYRGGLPLATLFSNKFNNTKFNIIKFQTRDGNDKEPILMNNGNLKDRLKYCYSNNIGIVLIDDIIDTGKTFEPIFEILEELTENYPLYSGKITIITLINNYDISRRSIKNMVGYSMYFNKEGIWFVFPWEDREEGIELLDCENPNSNELVENIKKTFESCLDILEKKNHDYNDNPDPLNNFFDVEKLGISAEQGILVRLNDKFNRIASLIEKQNKVSDESVQDTIDDAINYFAILKEVLKRR